MPDSQFNISLNFSDGVTAPLTVRTGESVLDAGLAAGVPLLHQCRSGSCSSCVARLVSGEAPMRAGASSTLLRSEAEAGQRLLCLTEVRSDCEFHLNYDSNAGANARAPVKAHAFVDGIERLGPDVVRLSLELADGYWIDFRPGQFLQIAIPGVGVVRSYSPASTPAALPKIELLIRLIEGGAMSSWLVKHAKRDDVIEIEGPFGAFFLRENVRAPHILIAGGTGLAPILSILDTLREQSGRKPSILLNFGCANPDTLFCREELTLRGHWLPTLETRISVDRGANGDLLEGNPVSALRDEDARQSGTVAYICGPPRMVDAARQRLEAMGLQPDNIFAEQFVASN